jgi:catalase
MATRKRTRVSSKNTRAAAHSRSASPVKAASRATVGGPARAAAKARAMADGEPLVAKVAATQALAAEFQENANKALEYDAAAALHPAAGQTAKPRDSSVTGSTVSEANSSAKVGAGNPLAGLNPLNDSLDRARVDSGGRALTTNQGVAVADNQSSLKAGLRGPTLLEDFILRTLIMSAFQNESCMPGAPRPTATLNARSR